MIILIDPNIHFNLSNVAEIFIRTLLILCNPISDVTEFKFLIMQRHSN